MTPHPPALAPRTAKVPLWLLVMVTLAGTLAIHMFVPGLPDAAQALHSPPGQMQLTITVYVIGLGVGQLIYGPLSDSLGRRPMLLIGLSLYTLAGLVALLAPNVGTLIGARLLQALGGCAGLALGRAIARDTATPETAVANLALLNLMMMVGPGLAPLAGTVIDAAWGWRGILAVLVAMGAVTLLGVWRLLPETSQPTGQLNWQRLRQDHVRLLRSRGFVSMALGGGCATMCSYGFLSAAPFIFTQQLHTSKHTMAVSLGLMIAGMAVGNAATRQLAGRVSLQRVLLGANLLCLLLSAVLLGLTAADQVHLAALIALMLVFNIGIGLTSPAALSQALNAEPELVGTAAGVYGCLQMALGALATLLVSLGSNPLLAAMAVLFGGNVIGAVGFRLAFRK
ncbi:Bcr/CflA family drug resistance efflux transporter [Comamonas serinivorans]|uniref:Bcr/CflA family efflux transporter n=1 Tax=Comamonas serinivorans TaxID=1082851 RepID=A0A1Y0END6_9BURK|nr:multidrug effflux MFS transporter [Comamonas serinivorans]ARU05155.1 Bcr/CflA family drug resistance efflux transporter [Comamonas serinivorans]